MAIPSWPLWTSLPCPPWSVADLTISCSDIFGGHITLQMSWQGSSEEKHLFFHHQVRHLLKPGHLSTPCQCVLGHVTASCYRPQKQDDIGSVSVGQEVSQEKQQEKGSEVRDCSLCLSLPSSSSSLSLLSSPPPLCQPCIGWASCKLSNLDHIYFQWHPEKLKVLAIYLNLWHKEHSQTFFRQWSYFFPAELFSDFLLEL